MSLSPTNSLLNPARPSPAAAPSTGDLINVLADALATAGYDLVPGSVWDEGLAAIGPDGRRIYIDLDHRAARATNDDGVRPVGAEVIAGMRRAVESFEVARRTF